LTFGNPTRSTDCGEGSLGNENGTSVAIQSTSGEQFEVDLMKTNKGKIRNLCCTTVSLIWKYCFRWVEGWAT